MLTTDFAEPVFLLNDFSDPICCLPLDSWSNPATNEVVLSYYTFPGSSNTEICIVDSPPYLFLFFLSFIIYLLLFIFYFILFFILFYFFFLFTFFIYFYFYLHVFYSFLFSTNRAYIRMISGLYSNVGRAGWVSMVVLLFTCDTFNNQLLWNIILQHNIKHQYYLSSHSTWYPEIPPPPFSTKSPPWHVCIYICSGSVMNAHIRHERLPGPVGTLIQFGLSSLGCLFMTDVIINRNYKTKIIKDLVLMLL